MFIRRTRALLRSRGTDQNSLFGEILDWMLAPLLFLWPITIVVTHHVASHIANAPYDKALADNVKAIARQVAMVEGRPKLNLPAPARALLRADEEDTVYYQVLGPKGEFVAGDKELPPPPNATEPSAEVHFRDEEIQGDDTRVAWQYLATGTRGKYAMVQVAETRAKRTLLARKIVSGVIFPQLLIIPLAIFLVYLGLARGITPLKRLKRLIEQRRPTDLAPIAVTGIPEEIRPLIVAFNGMMTRLEEAQHAQQRFIADAAHQMRTPLTGLMMQAELALDESDPVQIRAFLERIAASTQRAAHLINQLLSLARAEASVDEGRAMEMVDLVQIGQDVALDMAPAAMSRGMDMGFEGPETPVTMVGSPVLLRELAKNLLDNAIKYTPPGGKITLRVSGATEDCGPLLEVEDTGIGIPETDRHHVFERFYRVLGSDAEGSGLGLAIVREIAENHGATVHLLPNPAGQGTLARATFPIQVPLGDPESLSSP